MPGLFVDNLTVIDCSILDPNRGLIGASWSVNVELFGNLDDQSMVFDFSKVKRTIKQVIDNEVDHKLLLPSNYSGIHIAGQDTVQIDFVDTLGEQIKHSSPRCAICQIASRKVSPNNVARHLREKVLAELPDNVERLNIKLHKEKGRGEFYTYSHGLKKHDGNCQRIAHGHRSSIKIWKDNRRSKSLEEALAERWQDIYLGTRADIESHTANRIRFAYQTNQGHFTLELPEDRVHLMNCDTTVECIAEHVVGLLETDSPEANFKVKAFEGIGKGAIAQSTKG